jgi:hypothetical protein
VVTIGDTEPSPVDEAADSPVLRTVRQKLRETQRRLRELEAKAAPAPEQLPVIGKKPTLEELDYDTDKFESALMQWHESKRKVAEHQQRQQQAQQAQQAEWEGRLHGYTQAKQALKDAARVLALPYAVGEKLTKAMPGMVLGRDVSLNELIDPTAERYSEAAEFREILETDEDSKKVFALAQGLESLKRQWGVHAAGVIMSAEPLMDVIPIMKREEDGAIITQFDQPPCEDLGLLKMDFLGLRNLTVLDDALENIRQNRGTSVMADADAKKIKSYMPYA